MNETEHSKAGAVKVWVVTVLAQGSPTIRWRHSAYQCLYLVRHGVKKKKNSTNPQPVLDDQERDAHKNIFYKKCCF